jgi:caffeoyl-CoA O-methyltransferase
MSIITPEVDQYLNSLTPKRHLVLEEMELRAESENFPAISPQVGMLLKLLALSIKAESALDLGSGYGYSALWIAQGLSSNGKVILTESNMDQLTAARENFQRLELTDKAVFRFGDAVKTLESSPGPFDLIFNDVDKQAYSLVLELAHTRLRPGGLFVTDNTLWGGKVADSHPDETTKAIMEFNQHLAKHPGFLSVQLPLRDGVVVAIKQ